MPSSRRRRPSEASSVCNHRKPWLLHADSSWKTAEYPRLGVFQTGLSIPATLDGRGVDIREWRKIVPLDRNGIDARAARRLSGKLKLPSGDSILVKVLICLSAAVPEGHHILGQLGSALGRVWGSAMWDDLIHGKRRGLLHPIVYQSRFSDPTS